ncbi:molybdenum cofactor guanylyltransferase [Enterococcus sp. AD013-P3]|uniref:molybdenum cofactor guanylyltransferase n=1 Tax=Enterococcus sp. AD013-P3 TaxID=3411036 RepID=UPI003B94FB74
MDLGEATAVVLCGGKSHRMGFNKALLQMDGQFVLAKTAQLLKKIFPEVVLMTDRAERFFEKPAFNELTIWEDDYPGCGPLGGITSALEKITTPYAFVMACDMPELSFAAVNELAQTGQTPQVLLYQRKGRLEPLFGFYHRSCLPVFKGQLEQGDGRIREQFAQLQVTTVPTDKFTFTNVNTPEELIHWKKMEGML